MKKYNVPAISLYKTTKARISEACFCVIFLTQYTKSSIGMS